MSKTVRWNIKNLVTLVSVGILVGTEFLGVAIAAGWALSGLFGLNQTFETVLMTIFGALGLYALVLFMKKAASIEPIRA